MEGEFSSVCGMPVPARECWEAEAGRGALLRERRVTTVTRKTEETL